MRRTATFSMRSARLSSLVYIPRPSPKARCRLFCFPYAGGSSASYIPWAQNLVDDFELACIELPGRGSRFLEPPYRRMSAMVADIVEEITKVYSDKPMVFFGHSMGARVAHYCSVRLQSQNALGPKHLILSGSAPPGVLVEDDIHRLSDELLIEQLAQRYGLSEAIWGDPELLQMSLSKLRADFEVIETCDIDANYSLCCGGTVLSGNHDKLKVHQVQQWERYFSHPINHLEIQGDHFYLDENCHDTLSVVNSISALVINGNG